MNPLRPTFRLLAAASLGLYCVALFFGWFLPELLNIQVGRLSADFEERWVLTLIVLPLIWAVLTLKNERRKRLAPQDGKCRHCGYDLRATPDRCPECGTATGEAT